MTNNIPEQVGSAALAVAIKQKTPSEVLQNLSSVPMTMFGNIQLPWAEYVSQLSAYIDDIEGIIYQVMSAMTKVENLIILLEKLQAAARTAWMRISAGIRDGDFRQKYSPGASDVATAADSRARYTHTERQKTVIELMIADAKAFMQSIIAIFDMAKGILSQLTTIGGMLGLIKTKLPDVTAWISKQFDLSNVPGSGALDQFRGLYDTISEFYGEVAPAAMAIKYDINFIKFLGEQYFGHTNRDIKELGSIVKLPASGKPRGAPSVNGTKSAKALAQRKPAGYIDGPGGFLWEATNRSTGLLTVNLKEDQVGICEIYRALWSAERKKWYKGPLLETGVKMFNHRNVTRYTFEKSGEDYGPEPVFVRGQLTTLVKGEKVIKNPEWLLAKPGQRYD